MEETSIAEKLLTLYTELREKEKDKKDTVKAYNEEIKRIKAEINEMLDDAEEDGQLDIEEKAE